MYVISLFESGVCLILDQNKIRERYTRGVQSLRVRDMLENIKLIWGQFEEILEHNCINCSRVHSVIQLCNERGLNFFSCKTVLTN